MGQKSYTVELTRTAEEVYTRIYEEAQDCLDAGDETNSKVKLFRIVEEVLDVIIPHDPFARDRALAGNLSNIFRIKKGRMRICYIGSSKLRKIYVLYISDTPRKAGDIRDPYQVFTRLVLSGQFDEVFSKLGVRRPDRKAIAGDIWIN